ncbi:MAG TPA: hypothetical protein VHO02_04070 [Fibrobacteria bacterium]|jgi:hypothetical protein|nr:hypothetical protein [Fibrobacteria bacterium]
MKILTTPLRVLAASLFLAGCAVIAPPIKATTKQAASLQAVHAFDSLPQADLYRRALAWANTRPDVSCRDLDTAQEAVPCQGLGSAPMDFGQERPFRYDMMIDVKDGKVRTRFSEIKWPDNDSTLTAGPNMVLQWGYVEGYFDRLKADLFRYLGNPVGEPWQLRNKAKDKDW